jgi:hypothetical protein
MKISPKITTATMGSDTVKTRSDLSLLLLISVDSDSLLIGAVAVVV